MEEITATCAYSGEELSFERIEGSPLWRCTNGFDPTEWISGIHFERLRKELLKRPGGKPARKLVCPYKGTEITILEHMGMIKAAGAFSPRACVWLTRLEALWECSWRNGKEPAFPKEIKVWVGDIKTRESDPAEGILERADNFSEQIGQAMQPS